MEDDDRMWLEETHYLLHFGESCCLSDVLPTGLLHALELSDPLFLQAMKVAINKKTAKKAHSAASESFTATTAKHKSVTKSKKRKSKRTVSPLPSSTASTSDVPTTRPPTPPKLSSSLAIPPTTSTTTTPTTTTTVAHVPSRPRSNKVFPSMPLEFPLLLLGFTSWAERDPWFAPPHHKCSSACHFELTNHVPMVFTCQVSGNGHVCGSKCNQSSLTDHQYICALTGTTLSFEYQSLSTTAVPTFLPTAITTVGPHTRHV